MQRSSRLLEPQAGEAAGAGRVHAQRGHGRTPQRARIQRCRTPSAQRALRPPRRPTHRLGQPAAQTAAAISVGGERPGPAPVAPDPGRGSNSAWSSPRARRWPSSLRAELPSLAVYVPPVFDPEDPSAFADIVGATADVLDRADPEFVFVGISYPKQQLLAFALIDQLRQQGRRPPVFLLIGGSFDMYVGRTPRAPAWMQRVGAEWFFRFLLEPRRLFRRYFIEDVRFLSIVGRELRAARGYRRQPPAGGRRLEVVAHASSPGVDLTSRPGTGNDPPGRRVQRRVVGRVHALGHQRLHAGRGRRLQQRRRVALVGRWCRPRRALERQLVQPLPPLAPGPLREARARRATTGRRPRTPPAGRGPAAAGSSPSGLRGVAAGRHRRRRAPPPRRRAPPR